MKKMHNTLSLEQMDRHQDYLDYFEHYMGQYDKLSMSELIHISNIIAYTDEEYAKVNVAKEILTEKYGF